MIAPATLDHAAPCPPPSAGLDGLSLIDQLLRDRPAVLARIDAGLGLPALVRAMLAVIVVGAALYGAALGSFRGGVQLGYAAFKLPLVLLATAVICAPTLTAVGRALGRPGALGKDIALVLTALAVGALVLVALAPVVLVGRALEVGYHHVILLAVLTCGAAGLASLLVVIAGLRAGGPHGAGLTILVVLGVFMLVGGQVAWTLRPYLVRPRTTEVPFVRAIEGSLFDAVHETVRSSQGHYPDREDAP